MPISEHRDAAEFLISISFFVGALVSIYADGSVLLAHGGTEMGQGLHTKIIQIASETLKTDREHIHIIETATDKVPNTSPTAASASSDLNGIKFNFTLFLRPM